MNAALGCPHFGRSPYARLDPQAVDHPLMIKLKTKMKGGRGCQICGSGTTGTAYVCINPECLFVGCGRDDKGHALEHYRARHREAEGKFHDIMLNIQALQCWCYECDDLLTPTLFLNLDDGRDEGHAATTPSASRSINASVRRRNSRASLIKAPVGVVGLYNLGNSCYMNAALQALLNCPSIMGFFYKCGAFIYRHNHRRISEALHKLAEAIFATTDTAISPSRLVREVKVINPMFHGYTQQDTMDFVRCLLDRVHEEIKVPLLGPAADHPDKLATASPSRRRSDRIAHQIPQTGTADKPSPPIEYHSIISDTFGGVLRSQIICQQCQGVSVKDDPFYDVSVQISGVIDGGKGGSKSSSLGYIGNLFSSIGESIGLNGKPVRLESCLGAFCAPEALEGRDRYRCEKCNEPVDSKKTLSFKELPQVLCLQLKRFRHESYFSSKIGTHVIFPIDNLDMSPFLHEDASERSRRETRYYLSAVISHRGTFGGGHYLAYCRNRQTGQWLEFDDSAVSVVSEEEVSRVQAYVLVYALVDWNARKEREEWAPQIAAAVPGKTKGGVYVSRDWFNRWLTIADPGPLDHRSVQCIHGNLRPERLVDSEELLQFLPQNAYDALASRHDEVSGLPPLTDCKVCRACLEEEELLDRRRKQEDADIQALDTSTIRPGELWYLISSDWLIRWGQFKSGVGPPPGPISNDLLMVQQEEGGISGDEPRPNLHRGTHYRGVNARVWQYFCKIYGGGPCIVRKSINIYAPAPIGSAGAEVDTADDVYVDVVGH